MDLDRKFTTAIEQEECDVIDEMLASGYTPDAYSLIVACRTGNVDIVSKLLELDIPNVNLGECLLEAVEAEHLNILNHLYLAGADVNYQHYMNLELDDEEDFEDPDDQEYFDDQEREIQRRPLIRNRSLRQEEDPETPDPQDLEDQEDSEDLEDEEIKRRRIVRKKSFREEEKQEDLEDQEIQRGSIVGNRSFREDLEEDLEEDL
jgi:hypothetical protein